MHAYLTSISSSAATAALNSDVPTKCITMLIDVATSTEVVVVGKFVSSIACTSVTNARGLMNKPLKGKLDVHSYIILLCASFVKKIIQLNE